VGSSVANYELHLQVVKKLKYRFVITQCSHWHTFSFIQFP